MKTIALHGDCSPQFRTTALSFGTGLVTGAARLADINGDGHLDVLITNNSIPNPSDANVWVLAGRGDGTFHEPQKFATGPSPYAAVPADLNGDGLIDVVTPLGGNSSGVAVLLGKGDGTLDIMTTSYYSGELFVLLNRGDGTFGTPRAFQQTETAEALATADFDGDGTFAAPERLEVGPNSFSVVTADFDHDGDIDIAALNETADCSPDKPLRRRAAH